jgi:hypothetical protein
MTEDITQRRERHNARNWGLIVHTRNMGFGPDGCKYPASSAHTLQLGAPTRAHTLLPATVSSPLESTHLGLAQTLEWLQLYHITPETRNYMYHLH